MASQIIRAGWFGWNPAVWPHSAEAKSAPKAEPAKSTKTKAK
jgi:hypothetical protein